MAGMCRLTAALALTVALTFTATAHAAVPADWPQAAGDAAREHWGATPQWWNDCTDPPVVLVDLPADRSGEARIAECAIAVDASTAWTWRAFCAAVVHEYGHFLALRHDAGGVMAPERMWTIPLPACDARAPAPTATAAPPASGDCQEAIRHRTAQLSGWGWRAFPALRRRLLRAARSRDGARERQLRRRARSLGRRTRRAKLRLRTWRETVADGDAADRLADCR